LKGLDYAPTISADGRTLYYVSNRPGSILDESGDPSHDFWAAKKLDRLDTVFFKPFNIDTTKQYGKQGVNTPLNEGAASIAADRQSLYFTGCNSQMVWVVVIFIRQRLRATNGDVRKTLVDLSTQGF